MGRLVVYRGLSSVLVFLVACGATEDTTPTRDASIVDIFDRDGGVHRDGGSITDAGDTRLEGFGLISGTCGEIDDEVISAAPAKFDNAIDFMMDGYDEQDFGQLTPGGQKIITDGNAGGSSILSEVFAYEVLHRCEAATLEQTELEVEYTDSMGKITDLVVTIEGERIGVSVTRAVKFPFDDPYPVADAEDLLTRKLQDIQASTANVKPSFAWTKQILHVIAYGPQHAESLQTAYTNIDAAVKNDTIVVVTVSNGDDAFLY